MYDRNRKIGFGRIPNIRPFPPNIRPNIYPIGNNNFTLNFAPHDETFFFTFQYILYHLLQLMLNFKLGSKELLFASYLTKNFVKLNPAISFAFDLTKKIVKLNTAQLDLI